MWALRGRDALPLNHQIILLKSAPGEAGDVVGYLAKSKRALTWLLRAATDVSRGVLGIHSRCTLCSCYRARWASKRGRSRPLGRHSGALEIYDVDLLWCFFKRR